VQKLTVFSIYNNQAATIVNWDETITYTKSTITTINDTQKPIDSFIVFCLISSFDLFLKYGIYVAAIINKQSSSNNIKITVNILFKLCSNGCKKVTTGLTTKIKNKVHKNTTIRVNNFARPVNESFQLIIATRIITNTPTAVKIIIQDSTPSNAYCLCR